MVRAKLHFAAAVFLALLQLHLPSDSQATVPIPEDQYVYGGEAVTLDGSGGDWDTYHWEQIVVGDEPEITLSNPDPPDGITTFTAPEREIGYVLTFRLTVTGDAGTDSAETHVFVRAPNEPRNIRVYPRHLGFRLEWDRLTDGEEYQIEFKNGYIFWFKETYFELSNLEEGKPEWVVIRVRNRHGEVTDSVPITLIPLRNYALPETLEGTRPPSDSVYTFSHYDIAGMNNGETDDHNDSRDGNAKREDYWGYLWSEPLLFDHVVYFTSYVLPDGGWFKSLTVQYTQDGVTWLDVPTRFRPEYDFSDQLEGKQPFTRYDMFIPVLRGIGLRIYGAPGGAATYTSIAELEVLADNVTERAFIVQGIDTEVFERDTATLDGRFTFSTRGAITSYQWEQVSGPPVTLDNANAVIAAFEAPGVDADEVLLFMLTASDGTETLSDDYVSVTVKNIVTTAAAGPDQSVEERSTVTLNGFGSRTTSGKMSYQWMQLSGIPVLLDNPDAAVCTFTAPIIWDYTEELTFRLDVDDGAGGTSSDEVTVEVRNTLAAPAWPYIEAAAPGTGYMTDLLHLGDTPADRILSPLDTNQDHLASFGREGFVEPAIGEAYDFSGTSVMTSRNPMTWTPVHSDTGMFADDPQYDDFIQYYAVCILCPDELPARFHFRHDDDVRVWNNGALVLSRDGWDGVQDQTRDFTLAAGLNSMTIKLREAGGGNHVALGITDTSDELFDDLWYSLAPSFMLADAYVVRKLPPSYQPGGTIEVELHVRVNPDNKPSSVTIAEAIPPGFPVPDPGGGIIMGGNIHWTLTGAQVDSGVLTYTLKVPAGITGGVHFAGQVVFSGVQEAIKGDDVVYQAPSAPQNLEVEILLSGYLSWNANPEEGVSGYRVFQSVNGESWAEIGFTSQTWFKDRSVTAGNTYSYRVSAVNASGIEGPASDESEPQAVRMELREAEDFNYGEGQWPAYGNCPPANEAQTSNDLSPEYDYFFQYGGYPKPNLYRPDDDVDIREVASGRIIMGYLSPGDWWRYSFDVPAPGPGDPQGGWVQVALRVASPNGGRVECFWDEMLVGSMKFTTGYWGAYDTFALEDQFQTSPGVHTLRVRFAGGQMDFDTVGVGFNWSPPRREDLFQDDFEGHMNIYVPDDLIAVGWTVINGCLDPNGAWRLWNWDDVPPLSPPPMPPEGMDHNYVVANCVLGPPPLEMPMPTSDGTEPPRVLSPMMEMNEELITPAIDCTNHTQIRLEFTKNYRANMDDTEYAQIAEVDVRSSEDGVAWGDWVNLLHWDRTMGQEYAIGPERVDLSAQADGKIIQIRWHFYQALFDYWFAIDELRISGSTEEEPPPEEPVTRTLGYVAGQAQLAWEAFGGGSYTVEYTEDISSGDWRPLPGQIWPTSETGWTGDITAIFDRGVYLRVRSQ